MSPGTESLFADRYRLGDRLGVGGMSTVRLAFDTRLERNVAVKLLAEHLAVDEAFVARFRREALAAARLVHPNIVQVYDFGTDDESGRQFIVMEHVEGDSCAELLRDHGPMEPEVVIDVCCQACHGLDYAHRNGVVHRDVKPGNLLRNREGVVKLADFGIAKAAEDSDITRVGSVIGTAAYLSPEQARGEPAGPGSDIYALGVVAYQLLTGRLPYQGSSLTDLARQQQAGPPTDVHAVATNVPAPLSAVVMRALASHPSQRFESAAEMEAALRDAERGVAPAPPSGAATVAMTGDATQVLTDRTDATRAMPPQRPRPIRPEPAAPRRARPAPARGRPRPRWGRRIATLLALALVAVALVYGALQIEELRNRPEITQVEGDLQQSLDSLREAIEDNTR